MDTASNKVIADVDASVTIQLLLLIDSGPRTTELFWLPLKCLHIHHSTIPQLSSIRRPIRVVVADPDEP